jgi:hypothetical protein
MAEEAPRSGFSKRIQPWLGSYCPYTGHCTDSYRARQLEIASLDRTDGKIARLSSRHSDGMSFTFKKGQRSIGLIH